MAVALKEKQAQKRCEPPISPVRGLQSKRLMSPDVQTPRRKERAVISRSRLSGPPGNGREVVVPNAADG
jgi:hypothetical protein